MKTYKGVDDIAPNIHNLSTRWRWVVSATPKEKAAGTHWIGG
jgi:hypothetical protein